MDIDYDKASHHRFAEHRTQPGERGIDLYSKRLFADVEATQATPLKCEIIDKNGIQPGMLTSAAFGKGFSETFNTAGTTILDLGSGEGNLSRDQAELGYRSKIVGIDLFGSGMSGDPSENIERSPQGVIGSWLKLPFADGSFDYILAYESFPRYIHSTSYSHQSTEGISSEEFKERSFPEISRVAKPGAIWRGTTGSQAYHAPGSALHETQERYGSPIFKEFLDHGWSKIIAFGKTFVAIKG